MTVRNLLLAGVVVALTLPLGAEEARKKVTQAEATSAAVNKVSPEYPAMAKQLRLSGSVEVEANIAEDGTVENVKVVSGNPVLTRAASAAVAKWKFKPFVANGAPVKAVTVLTFDFKP
jgi:periplasmic protein TonB